MVRQDAVVEQLGPDGFDPDTCRWSTWWPATCSTGGHAGWSRLKSPPKTSGAPAAHSSAAPSASAQSARVRAFGSVVACRLTTHEPRPGRPVRHAALGQLRQLGDAVIADLAAHEQRVAAAAPRLHQVGVALGDRRRHRPEPVARGGRRARLGAGRAGERLGHHGGTSWSIATSHSQPASAAANCAASGAPAGGCARPWKRFQVRTRMVRRTVQGEARASRGR